MHLNLLDELGTVLPEQTGERMIIRFVEELNAASLSQLPEGFDESGVPPLALFDEDSCYAVGDLEAFGIMLEAVYLLQNDVVGWKVTLSGSSLEDLSVQGMVKI
jgi:hypothetical protein